MHYYIDGYNLLFRILRAGDDMRKQREEITHDLERKINLLEIDATLVFDSHYQEGESEKSHFKSLELIFTSKGETADEYILQELKESKNPSQHTVVTSDKRLARLCKLRLAQTLSVEEFLSWIGKRYKNKLRPKKSPAEIPTPPTKKPSTEPLALPTSLESVENCFDYYLDTFEKQVQEQEKSIPPPKPQPLPKKIKVKKRQLTKEEQALSDAERWLKAFEKGAADDSENFVV